MYNNALHCVALHCTTLHCSVMHCTVQSIPPYPSPLSPLTLLLQNNGPYRKFSAPNEVGIKSTLSILKKNSNDEQDSVKWEAPDTPVPDFDPLNPSALRSSPLDLDDEKAMMTLMMDSKKYDEDEKDKEENNLSFEQLKHELIIHKRKKKEKKMVKINENPTKCLMPSLSDTPDGTMQLLGDACPEDGVDYWRVMSLLDAPRKRAKTVVEMFLPSVYTMRRLIRVRDLPLYA